MEEPEDVLVLHWKKKSGDSQNWPAPRWRAHSQPVRPLGVVLITSLERVIVDYVEAHSPASELGITAGLQLLSVDGVEVSHARDAVKLLNKARGVAELKLTDPTLQFRVASTWRTVKWAVKWAMTNYRKDFIQCVLLVSYHVYSLSTAPLFKQYLFETAMPRYLVKSISMCGIDTIATLAVMSVTAAVQCQTKFWLDLSKMDGAAFVPLMQRQLATHLTSLPQRMLDQCNEIALLSLIQEDVTTLDKVIGAIFEMVGSLLTLLILVPVLATLSGELTIIVLTALPIFMWMQMRVAEFMATAADALRESQALFMRLIEENLVFAKTKRLLGLSDFMNSRLESQQGNVFKSFMFLDRANAVNDRRLNFFGFFLETGVILAGVMLMNIEKTASTPSLTLGDGGFPPPVCISELISGASSQDQSTTSGVVYYLTLPTLFSIVTSVGHIKGLLIVIVRTIRTIQTGRASLIRVQFYLDQYPEPTPKHVPASQLAFGQWDASKKNSADEETTHLGESSNGNSFVNVVLAAFNRKQQAVNESDSAANRSDDASSQSSPTHSFQKKAIESTLYENSTEDDRRSIRATASKRNSQRNSQRAPSPPPSPASARGFGISLRPSQKEQSGRQMAYFRSRTCSTSTTGIDPASFSPTGVRGGAAQSPDFSQLSQLNSPTSYDAISPYHHEEEIVTEYVDQESAAQQPDVIVKQTANKKQQRHTSWAAKSPEMVSSPVKARRADMLIQSRDSGVLPALSVEIFTFGYGPKEVLRQVSFSIPQGARVGVLGSSGSGKSTLLSVMTRLYPLKPWQGMIKVLGTPLNELVVHKAITIMEQSPCVFDGTVRENLVLDLHVEDESLIQRACVNAKFWEDVSLLPGQLDFEVGHRGKNLSGGQRQRLCLARSLLRNTPLLFLDEPVSSQDAQITNEISSRLGDLTFDSKYGSHPVTIFALTHNLEFLQTFTHIVYVANGTVVECGTKEDLLSKRGHYYRRVVQNSGISIDHRGQAQINAERLRFIWLFANAPSEDLEELAKRFATVNVRRYDAITRKGASRDAMYIIVNGTLKADECKESDESLAWAPGQELGVDSLVHDETKWDITVRVSSEKAVLLKLEKTDLEEMLKRDGGFAKSVGAIAKQIQSLRSVQRLQHVWPLFGASHETLSAISSGMRVVTVEQGTTLCNRDQIPADPLRSLYMIAQGALLSTSEKGEVKLSKGAVLGMTEVLPAPVPPVIEKLMKGDDIQTLQACESCILIELSRGKLANIVNDHPTLADTYRNNAELWGNAVDPDSLSRNWLLGCFTPDVLSRISSAWTPRVYSEDTEILRSDDERADYCIIVLAGQVQLDRRIAGVSDPVTQLAPLGVPLNELRLICTSSRQSLNDFGETLLSARALSDAFVIRLHRDTFKKHINKAYFSQSMLPFDNLLPDDDNSSTPTKLKSLLSRGCKKKGLLSESTASMQRDSSKSCDSLSKGGHAKSLAGIKAGSLHSLTKNAPSLAARKSGRLSTGSPAANSALKQGRSSDSPARMSLTTVLAAAKCCKACKSSRSSLALRSRNSASAAEVAEADRQVETEQAAAAAGEAADAKMNGKLQELSDLAVTRGEKLQPSWFREMSRIPSAITDEQLAILCEEANTIVAFAGERIISPPGERRVSVQAPSVRRRSLFLGNAKASESPRAGALVSPKSPKVAPSLSPPSSPPDQLCLLQPVVLDSCQQLVQHQACHGHHPRSPKCRTRAMMYPQLSTRCSSNAHEDLPSPPASPAVSLPYKVHIPVASMRGGEPRNEYIFVVLKGSLHAKDERDLPMQLNFGDVFTNSLSSCWGESKLPVARLAVASEHCILLRLSLVHITDTALADKNLQEAAMQRAEAARTLQQQELAALSKQLHGLEVRLGYREKLKREDIPRKFRKVLWLIRSAKFFLRGGSDFMFTFTEELSLSDQIANLSEEIIRLQKEVYSREDELGAYIAEWQALQPAIFAEEAAFQVTHEEFPMLNVARSTLDEAATRVADLKAFREQRRLAAISNLHQLWDVNGVEGDERRRILDRSQQPDQRCFEVIEAEETSQRARLAAPMRALNGRINTAWAAMQLPDGTKFSHLRDNFIWNESDLPTIAQMRAAELQANVLEEYATMLSPILDRHFKGKSSAVGEVIAQLLSCANDRVESVSSAESTKAVPESRSLKEREGTLLPTKLMTRSKEAFTAAPAPTGTNSRMPLPETSKSMLRPELESQGKVARDAEVKQLVAERDNARKQLAELLKTVEATRQSEKDTKERMKMLLDQAEREKAALQAKFNSSSPGRTGFEPVVGDEGKTYAQVSQALEASLQAQRDLEERTKQQLDLADRERAALQEKIDVLSRTKNPTNANAKVNCLPRTTSEAAQMIGKRDESSKKRSGPVSDSQQAKQPAKERTQKLDKAQAHLDKPELPQERPEPTTGEINDAQGLLAEALNAKEASQLAQQATEERTKQLLEQAEREKAELREQIEFLSRQEKGREPTTGEYDAQKLTTMEPSRTAVEERTKQLLDQAERDKALLREKTEAVSSELSHVKEELEHVRREKRELKMQLARFAAAASTEDTQSDDDSFLVQANVTSSRDSMPQACASSYERASSSETCSSSEVGASCSAGASLKASASLKAGASFKGSASLKGDASFKGGASSSEAAASSKTLASTKTSQAFTSSKALSSSKTLTSVKAHASTSNDSIRRSNDSPEDEYGRLRNRNKELVREIFERMGMLQMPKRAIDAFSNKSVAKIPPPVLVPTNEDMLQLTRNANELEQLVENLRNRCETDGLLYALRQICAMNMWKPKELAKQITQGHSSLKDAKNTAAGTITKEQFTHWLNVKRVAYNEASLAYFYNAVNCPDSSFKMKSEDFIQAIGTVKKHSISIGTLEQVALVQQRSSVSMAALTEDS